MVDSYFQTIQGAAVTDEGETVHSGRGYLVKVALINLASSVM